MCAYILLLVYGKVQKSAEKVQVRWQVTTSKWRIADAGLGVLRRCQVSKVKHHYDLSQSKLISTRHSSEQWSGLVRASWPVFVSELPSLPASWPFFWISSTDLGTWMLHLRLCYQHRDSIIGGVKPMNTTYSTSPLSGSWGHLVHCDWLQIGRNVAHIDGEAVRRYSRHCTSYRHYDPWFACQMLIPCT